MVLPFKRNLFGRTFELGILHILFLNIFKKKLDLFGEVFV